MCLLITLFDSYFEPKPKKTKEQEQIEKQQKQIEQQRRAWKRNIRYMK